jgi:exportin-T
MMKITLNHSPLLLFSLQIVHSFKFFIKNKMAQIFSLVFISDYPLKWPQFFNDVLSLFYQHSSVYTFDIYLRTLLAIDSEIVDRDIIHSHEDNVRNTLIKDTIRDTCAGELVETWLSLLSSHKSLHHEILCQTMSVIGHYITWMDISLIANDKFIG